MIQIMRSFISGGEKNVSEICSNDVDREELNQDVGFKFKPDVSALNIVLNFRAAHSKFKILVFSFLYENSRMFFYCLG